MQFVVAFRDSRLPRNYRVPACNRVPSMAGPSFALVIPGPPHTSSSALFLLAFCTLAVAAKLLLLTSNVPHEFWSAWHFRDVCPPFGHLILSSNPPSTLFPQAILILAILLSPEYLLTMGWGFLMDHHIRIHTMRRSPYLEKTFFFLSFSIKQHF